MKKKNYGCQWGPDTVWFFTVILQNIFFRVHTGLEKVESKLWQNLNFWVDCSFSGQLEMQKSDSMITIIWLKKIWNSIMIRSSLIQYIWIISNYFQKYAAKYLI